MKRLLFVFSLCLIWAATGFAQTAVVKRKVNLRKEPSTASGILESLAIGTELTLVESNKRDGFYHVTAPDGQTGWTWSRNVAISSSSTTPTGGAPPSPTPESVPLFAMLKSARKTAVPQPLVLNGVQICGPTGNTNDSTAIALNTNKNRTDIPADSDYVDLSWSQLKNLPTNHVSDFVSAPVRVIGFLSHQIKVENTGHGESTNCNKTVDDEVDWHSYFTQSSAQPISAAIIIETTPRTRPLHKWTTSMLSAVVNTGTQVRISGWLMYDSEHTGVVGTQRATVWEVHPITKIEIRQNNQWVDLDETP
jgi:uncharacterized protein YgiM (DUF1202 family)